MDIYIDRPLELGQKIPYGKGEVALHLGEATYWVGNPSRTGASFPVKLKAAVYSSDTEVLNLVAEVQPSSKALDHGYAFQYQPGVGPEEADRILAYLGTGPHAQVVGELSYRAVSAYLEDVDVLVDPAHRRRGIATGLYQQAELLTGKSFLCRAGEPLPIDAAALWASPDRPFGVDALYAQPRRLLWVNLADLLPAPLKALPRVLFDAERFAASATGQRCKDVANSGGCLRGGLQDARIRGLMPRGHEGVVETFATDPQAAPKYLRAVLCGEHPTRLGLCNARGLPEPTISPTLPALTEPSREAVLAFIGEHAQALADLDALSQLLPQVQALARLRRAHRDVGGLLEEALLGRRARALSLLTDLHEKDAEFRASQL
jgi:GNAT superfamily N-acetyltransferase